MCAYSKDRSLKVLDAVGHGVPRKEELGVFNVSLITVKHWLKRRKGGSRGRPRLSEEKRSLWEQLKSNAGPP